MTLLHKIKKGGALAAMTLGLAALSATAHADYPERPIQLIVGYPPGGSADVVARPLAVMLGKKLGVPVVVENRPGAGSSIGTQVVARATDLPPGRARLRSGDGHGRASRHRRGQRDRAAG